MATCTALIKLVGEVDGSFLGYKHTPNELMGVVAEVYAEKRSLVAGTLKLFKVSKPEYDAIKAGTQSEDQVLAGKAPLAEDLPLTEAITYLLARGVPKASETIKFSDVFAAIGDWMMAGAAVLHLGAGRQDAGSPGQLDGRGHHGLDGGCLDNPVHLDADRHPPRGIALAVEASGSALGRTQGALSPRAAGSWSAAGAGAGRSGDAQCAVPVPSPPQVGAGTLRQRRRAGNLENLPPNEW